MHVENVIEGDARKTRNTQLVSDTSLLLLIFEFLIDS